MSYVDSYHLNDFLSELKLVLEEKDYVDQLDAWWDRECANVESLDPDVDLVVFLADIAIQELPQLTSTAERMENKFVSHRCITRQDNLAESNRYWWFKPAWRLEKDLQTAFGMQDPALTIVRWLRKLYTPNTYSHPPKNSETIFVKPGTNAAELIHKIKDWVTLKIKPEFLPLWRFLQYDEEYEVKVLEELASRSKHAIFDLYIRGCDEDVGDPGDRFKYFLNLPFSGNADPYGDPHITPQNLPYCVGFDLYTNVKIDLKQDWRTFIANFKNFRSAQYGGRSPVPSMDLNFVLEQICWTQYGASCFFGFSDLIRDLNIDSTLLLTKFYDYEEDVCLDGEVGDINRGLEYFYIPLIQLLRDERMLELSDALMAFCLFVIGKRQDGNLELFGQIYHGLELAAFMPVNSLTQKSIEIVQNIAAKNDQALTVDRLSQYVTTQQAGIQHYLQSDESEYLEYKSTLRWDLKRACMQEGDITHSVMKTIAAFINTKGGVLLVGVTDDKKITGLKHDYDKNQRNSDELCLWLNTRINLFLTGEAHKYFSYHITKYRGDELLVVECMPGKNPIYCKERIKVKNPNEEFFVRRGPSSEKIDAPREFGDYIKHRFS